MQTTLEVRSLKTGFWTPKGDVVAVDDVSFTLGAGETLGIVGESGCGKSVTSLSLMRLLPKNTGRVYSGEVFFNDGSTNRDLLKVSESEMRKIRGGEIAMIFQDPMTALNPVFTCGHQIQEAISLHSRELTSSQARKKSIEMIELVGIPDPEKRAKEYPHQLSGGMRQRIMIAMALSCDPKVLIADEPTTALDVTIQAQILDLIHRLQSDLKASMILITHDLGVVAEVCDRIAVMYAGKIVEIGTAEDIFYHPQHQYTKGLLNSVPHFESGKRRKRLNSIPGMVPSLFNLPKGCRFQDRCDLAEDRCKTRTPELISISKTHSAACIHAAGSK